MSEPVEVQLQRVDALKAQLHGPDRGEPVGAAGLVELVQQLGVGGFELDGVAVRFEAGGVAGLGAADQVEGPLDQDERQDPLPRCCRQHATTSMASNRTLYPSS